MEPDTPFTRRVCAVLLADVSGFSTLMGENDEHTARWRCRAREFDTFASERYEWP